MFILSDSLTVQLFHWKLKFLALSDVFRSEKTFFWLFLDLESWAIVVFRNTV